MRSAISFVLDGKKVDLDFKGKGEISPTTTVLNYLREISGHKGVKEGCAEGDCGACTVVIGEPDRQNRIRYVAVDSCLIFLPMIHGKQLITVENLKDPAGRLHPVQQAMVEMYGSQCGFCTPGIVMSIFALYKNHPDPTLEQINDALTGNLCRCTGYRPIAEAAAASCVHDRVDHFTPDEKNIVSELKSIGRESVQIRTDRQIYFRPVSLGEAVSLKHQHKDAVVLGGATDVALRVTKGHELMKEVIDLSGIMELKEISLGESSVTIGAGAVMNDIMPEIRHRLPALYEMLKVFGSHQIRNVATLGGNLGSASPIGDTIPLLMAYRAKIVLEGLNGRREVEIDDFITGYRKTVLKTDELITSIIIPNPDRGSVIGSYKVSKRKDLDISTVSAGFHLEREKGKVVSVRLAYGGMAERTKRAVQTENYLAGREWSRKTIEQAMPFIERDFTPITDARGSARFRSRAAQNLLLKFWLETAG